MSSCKVKERGRAVGQKEKERACETDKQRETEGDSVHSWPCPVGCGLRKATVGVTCVGGVSQTERHWPGPEYRQT